MNRNSSLCNAIFVLNLTCRKLHFFYTFYGDFNVIVSSIVSLTLSTFHIALYSQCSKFLYELSYRNNLIHVYLFAHQTCTIDTSSIPFDSPSTPTPPHPHYVLVPDSYLTTQHKIQRNVH